MNKTTKTVDKYMKDAVDCINERFGQGFAEQNPNLISGFIIAAAISDLTKKIPEEQIADTNRYPI